MVGRGTDISEGMLSVALLNVTVENNEINKKKSRCIRVEKKENEMVKWLKWPIYIPQVVSSLK